MTNKEYIVILNGTTWSKESPLNKRYLSFVIKQRSLPVGEAGFAGAQDDIYIIYKFHKS